MAFSMINKPPREDLTITLNSADSVKIINELRLGDEIDNSVGRKYDTGKTQYRLMSPYFIAGVSEILTVGAKKYSADNWLYVSDGRNRYTDAALRHLYDYLKGDKLDEETNKSHLLHAACNIMFLYEFDRLGR